MSPVAKKISFVVGGAVLVIVLVVVIAIASIDGGDDAAGADTDSGNRSEQQFPSGAPPGGDPPSGVVPGALQAFQDCLEEQGVQLPSPDGQGGGPPSGFDPDDPELQAALSACEDELPEGIGPG